MLKVIGSIAACTPEATFGDYMPFRVVWRTSANPSYWWETGSRPYDAVEIRLDPTSGDLRALTAVCVRDVHRWNPCVEVVLPTLSGLPIFDISNWPENRYKDDFEPVRLLIATDRLRLLFSPETSHAVRVLESGPITFGIDGENALSYFEIRDLSPESVEAMSSTTEMR